jgi:hypothetical protein
MDKAAISEFLECGITSSIARGSPGLYMLHFI